VIFGGHWWEVFAFAGILYFRRFGVVPKQARRDFECFL
jgi:hypothetical protein